MIYDSKSFNRIYLPTQRAPNWLWSMCGGMISWNQLSNLGSTCWIWIPAKAYEGRSKFVVERKCVTKLVSPLSFYMVSCFYIFLPLPKHSFEASLLGSSSLPIFVCMHWETLVVFVVSHVVPPLRCSGGLSNQQLFWKENGFLACFGHSQLLI